MYEEDEQRNLKNKLNQHNQQLQETSSKRKTAKRSMPFNNDNKN